MGIEALPRALAESVPSERVALERPVAEIDLGRHLVIMEDGARVRYERLISTLPLPVLGRFVRGGPADRVADLAGRVKGNRVHTVNIGLRGNELGPITDMHWVYFPEEDFPFHRLSLPHRFSSSMVPSGDGSLQLEVSESSYRPVEKDSLVERCLAALVRLGVLGEGDAAPAEDGGRIRLTEIVTLDPAYVIYHLRHRETIGALKEALASVGVVTAGRFGEWEYFNMDHSIMSGKAAAEVVLGSREGSLAGRSS